MALHDNVELRAGNFIGCVHTQAKIRIERVLITGAMRDYIY